MVRTNATVIAALAVQRGEADAMICGLEGRFHDHLRFIDRIIGIAPNAPDYSTVSLLIGGRGAYFLTDTYVTPEPDARSVADCAILAAKCVERFGIAPKMALLSHSEFRLARHAVGAQDARGARPHPRACARSRGRRRDAWATSRSQPGLRERLLPNSDLKGEANLLVFPNLDAANIASQLSNRSPTRCRSGRSWSGPRSPRTSSPPP